MYQFLHIPWCFFIWLTHFNISFLHLSDIICFFCFIDTFFFCFSPPYLTTNKERLETRNLYIFNFQSSCCKCILISGSLLFDWLRSPSQGEVVFSLFGVTLFYCKIISFVICQFGICWNYFHNVPLKSALILYVKIPKHLSLHCQIWC